MKRKPKRKYIIVRISYPVDMTAKNVRNHVGAAINWWAVKVIPEANLKVRMVQS